MKWNNLYIGGLSDYIPLGRQSAEWAIRQGRFTEEDLARTQQHTLVAADALAGETAPEMAAAAARKALAQTGSQQNEIDLLIHTVVLSSGLEAWNSSAYVANAIGQPNCISLEMRAACAGAVLALEVAGKWLQPQGRAVITASDTWQLPLFDRWGSDRGVLYGDAGAAVVLQHYPGPFEVLATSVSANSSLEGIHRGNTPMSGASYTGAMPIDLRERAKEYAQRNTLDDFWAANASGLSASVTTALADAGVGRKDVTLWTVPHFGMELLERQCFAPLGLSPTDTLVDYGLGIGHVGAADPLLALAEAVRRGVRPGDIIVLIGIGAGFVWGSSVLRATDMIENLPQSKMKVVNREEFESSE